MRQNNWEHYDIVQKLSKRFSFTEYESECRAQGVAAKSILDYAQKVGLLTVAEQLYPDLSGKEAYMRLFANHSTPHGGSSTEPVTAPKLPQPRKVVSTCGSCGGGEVL